MAPSRANEFTFDAGLVPAVDADRAAIELGVHPLHIWIDFHRDVA